MAGFNLNALGKILDDDKGEGVSFEGRAINFGNASEAKELIDAIVACPKLDYLNLEGNTLGVEAAEAIANALAKHPEFKRALWKDLFTGRLKTEIPQALNHLGKGMQTAGAHLTVLDCSDNALGPNGMIGLVPLLKSSTCYSLQELKLNNCGLGIGGGTMLAQALTDCLAASQLAGTPLQLKVFIAGRNRLENDGAKALASIFGKIKTLELVAMPQNGIYHVGITALSEALKLNGNMKILNLNDNTIGTKGASALAEAMESMQKLVEINFGDCLLKTGGAIYLAEALQDRHTDLEIVNLGYNEIGSDGGLSIVSAMLNKVNLHTLILNGNHFGSDCCDQIAETLESIGKGDVLDELNENDSEGEDENDEDLGDEEEDDDGDDDDDDDDDDDEEIDEEETYDQYVESDTEEAGDEVSFSNQFKSLNTTLDATSYLNNSSIYYDGEYSRPDTVETFLNTPNPTVEMFNRINENDKIFAFHHFLESFADEEYLIFLVFAILKCSAISTDSEEALNVSQALYKECFDYATKTNQLNRVKDFFLIHMGLLKSEDKFKPIYNVAACRSALTNAINKKSFSDDVTSTFECFLKLV